MIPIDMDVEKIISSLEILAQDGGALAQIPEDLRIALFRAAGRLSRPDRTDSRKRLSLLTKFRKKETFKQNKTLRAQTGIRIARAEKVYQAPLPMLATSINKNINDGDEPSLKGVRNCYICREEFSKLHFFYDSMCGACAEFNYQKRFQTAPLNGQVALITGARLKIGYHAALMMLRAGAQVICTTRFPKDAAIRFSLEADFSKWNGRLQIFGLDLRHTPSVEIFAKYIEQSVPRLDILINNAAQTVRRPPGFYSHLIENELKAFDSFSKDVQKILSPFETCKLKLNLICKSLPGASDTAPLVAWHGHGPGVGLRASALLSQIPYTYDASLDATKVFPTGKLDADLQQVDLRASNSWRLRLSEVPAPEMLEVQLVNAVAPFVLTSKLLPLMRKDFTGQKHIVNVTAMEGKFHRTKKIDRHPHTNMAKAALNMLTHTSAGDLEKSGIYMNAVDTGWVTDEDPVNISVLKKEIHDFQPPLDIVDGAARICDPFFHGITSGRHWSGCFLKDYKPTDW
jgi:NAD(P)-dependent dehydrogenase (short-subunit alcohol dehydrogenase family)